MKNLSDSKTRVGVGSRVTENWVFVFFPHYLYGFIISKVSTINDYQMYNW